MGNIYTSKRMEEKDLGVMFTDHFSLEKHLKKVGKTQSIEEYKSSIANMNEDMIRKIILMSTMIHPKLNCVAVVWSSS